MTVFPYRQPSPRGEGAPKGRIGHRRYERGWRNASQVYDLRKHPIHRSAVPLPNGEGKSVTASPRSMAQVAAVLAFVISHTTFLAAQDDETGRCPKVVCKSLVISNPCGLTYVGANPASLRSAAPSRGRGERMRLCDVRSRLWKAEVSGQKSKVQSLKSDV